VSVRILLVDDQPLLRTGFRMILEAEPGLAVVGRGQRRPAGGGAGALAPADVVLMDIRMPRMDGVEATRRIAGPGRDGTARVLVLTTFDLDEYVVEALRAGASGFLLKDVPADDLIAAIKLVAAGDAVVAPASPDGCSTGSPAGCPARTRRRPRRSSPSPTASSTCCGWSPAAVQREIAADLFVSETTVKTHVGHV
jgi:DNA-binding NarL/FixJ family response regulator